MPLYKNNTTIKMFDFGINISKDFFWWAKNKDRTLTIFEVENDFKLRNATLEEEVFFNLKLEDAKNTNLKIGKAKTEDELKNQFLKSEYRLRYEIFKKLPSKKIEKNEETKF